MGAKGRRKAGSIADVVATVLRAAGEPMTPRAVFDQIVERGLYLFKAKHPFSVLKGQLRRHTKGWDYPSAEPIRYFEQTADGRFRLLDPPIHEPPSLFPVSTEKKGGQPGPLVSVPEDEDEVPTPLGGPSHTEIQWRLLNLGAQLGLTTWAPIADRTKAWDGRRLGDLPGMTKELPVQFGPAAMRTIQYIDVIWVRDGNYVAGFEVEHSTTIYSGLLRLSDLVTMTPNIHIKLYLVAPDERAAKFAREVARPTFSQRTKPLHSVCRFLPYSNLVDKLNEVKTVIPHLRPEFLDDIAEAYTPGTGEPE